MTTRSSRSIPPIVCDIDADGLTEAARILRAGIDALSDRDSLRGYDFDDNRVTGMSVTSQRNGWDVRVTTGRTTSVSMSLQGSGRSVDFDFDENVVPHVDDLDALDHGAVRRIRTALSILARIPTQNAHRLAKASAVLEETARAVLAHAGASGHPDSTIVLVAPSAFAQGRCDVHSRPSFHSEEVQDWALDRLRPLLHAFCDESGTLRRYRLRRASIQKTASGPMDIMRDLSLLPQELRP